MVVRPNTVNEEVSYVTDFLHRHTDFNDIVLPKGMKHPTRTSHEEVSNCIHLEYDITFYANGLLALKRIIPDIANATLKLQPLSGYWGFTLFPECAILLTRYGPGGSYNPDQGSVVLLTRLDGTFKRANPLHSVLHEIVHIGIEFPIVKKYKLLQWEKERLVDRIVLEVFGSELHDYKPRVNGDRRLDAYLVGEWLQNLPEVIERFVHDNPR